MKNDCPKIKIVFILALLFVCSGTPAFADIPWPSMDTVGEVATRLSESHAEQIIAESLKDKYVPGTSDLLDIVYAHDYVSIDKEGNRITYSDSAIRANTPQAREVLGEFTVRFNESKESIEILQATVYLPGGKQVSTNTTLARTREPFTHLVYSDMKIKALSISGVEEGAILRIVLKRTYRPGVEKGFVLLPLMLDPPMPLKEYVAVIRCDAGGGIVKKERVNQSSRLTSDVFKKPSGETYYVYQGLSLKPRIPEVASVPSSEIGDKVLFYNQSTWNDVARWWTKLYAPKAVASKDIDSKVAELTKGLSNRDDKIKSLYDFVKGFRYVSIVLNENTFVPHSADETFENKYGDCKDKAVLLVTMLRSIGVNATVALVDTSGLVDRETPSPLHFDHAIVAIPKPDATYVFLDPTNPVTPYGLTPSWIQYRHALVPDGKAGNLVLIPPQAPRQNSVEETYEANIQDLRAVTVSSKCLTYSSNVFYHMLPTIPQSDLVRMLKEVMAKEYKDFDIVSVKEEPADSKGVLKSETVVKIRDFAKRMGKVHAFNPLFDADKLGQEDVIGTSSRTTDIELDAPKRLVSTSLIRVPPSIAFEFVPKSVTIENGKFGSYAYEVTQSEGLLKVRREVEIVAKRVAVKDYAEFREFYKACLTQDEELVGIKTK